VSSGSLSQLLETSFQYTSAAWPSNCRYTGSHIMNADTAVEPNRRDTLYRISPFGSPSSLLDPLVRSGEVSCHMTCKQDQNMQDQRHRLEVSEDSSCMDGDHTEMTLPLFGSRLTTRIGLRSLMQDQFHQPWSNCFTTSITGFGSTCPIAQILQTSTKPILAQMSVHGISISGYASTVFHMPATTCMLVAALFGSSQVRPCRRYSV
jgi:hypothetical protein